MDIHSLSEEDIKLRYITPAITKQGWSVNPVPAMAYDSDFGLMVGGFLDINYYGGLYPNYKHRICLEALAYRAGTGFSGCWPCFR